MYYILLTIIAIGIIFIISSIFYSFIHVEKIERFDETTRITVATLTRGFTDQKGYDLLIKRNQSVLEHLYYAMSTRIDILIFHEGNVTLADMDYIQSQTPTMPLTFVNVEPEFLHKPSLTSKTTTHCHNTALSDSFPIGYKHMCRFWFSRFLDYTETYKYVIRIDEDCVIHSFPKDVIDYMDANNLKLVTARMDNGESPDVIVGLQDFVMGLYNKQIEFKFPYTNLVIFDADYFRSSSSFKDFVGSVEASNCIYVNRWGDLPLWGVVVQVLMPRESSMEEKRIMYIHGSHNEQVN